MSDERALLFRHLLPLIAFDGWSDHAMRQAAKRANLDEAAVKRAFPRGVKDAVAYLFSSGDAQLAEAFPPAALEGLRVPEKIEKLVMQRLALFASHREALRLALAYGALPWNFVDLCGWNYHTVDAIWRLAGDASTDFNFYTKRMTLAAVYASTRLFWLNDDSENSLETAGFLKRRLKNVADFGKWKKAVTS